MKKLLLFSLLIALLAAYSGCKKDDSNDESNTPGLSVKIGGTLWNAPVYLAAHINSQGLTTISASTTDVQKQLHMAFKGYETGTYAFDTEDSENFGQYGDLTTSKIYNTIGMNSSGGEIVVTKYDKTNKLISGTFHLRATEFFDETTLDFTEGVFTNIPYTEE